MNESQKESLSFVIQMLNNYLVTLAPGVREITKGAMDFHIKNIESGLTPKPDVDKAPASE